jgi:hypothetical protein
MPRNPSFHASNGMSPGKTKVASAHMGESRSRVTGFELAARIHRGDPGTWETRDSPRRGTGGGRLTKTQVGHVGAMHVSRRQGRSIDVEVDRRRGATIAEVEGIEGVGGPHMSDDAG